MYKCVCCNQNTDIYKDRIIYYKLRMTKNEVFCWNTQSYRLKKFNDNYNNSYNTGCPRSITKIYNYRVKRIIKLFFF